MEKIENNFKEKIKDVCVVDFWAPWCGPCKMFGPIFEEAENKYDNIKFYKYNVDLDSDGNCKELGIMSIPTIILFKDGKEIKRNIGFMSENEFEEFINE